MLSFTTFDNKILKQGEFSEISHNRKIIWAIPETGFNHKPVPCDMINDYKFLHAHMTVTSPAIILSTFPLSLLITKNPF
jgi:hypothetical protein